MRGPSPRRGRRPGRLPAAAAAVAAVALLLPGAALAANVRAHGSGGLTVPFAFLGIDIPSISSILRSIANGLFKVLAGAFLPSWLRHAPASVLRWLIALPNPADPVQWPTMHRLEQDTTSVAVAFLPLTLAIAAARYTASGVTGGAHHPVESLGRLVGAAFGLLIFPWAFSNVVAAVNVTTGALSSSASTAHGSRSRFATRTASFAASCATTPSASAARRCEPFREPSWGLSPIRLASGPSASSSSKARRT